MAVVVATSTAVLTIGLFVALMLGQGQSRADALTPGAAADGTGFGWSITWSTYNGQSLRSLVVDQPLAIERGDPVTLHDGESLVSRALMNAIEDDPSVAVRVPGQVVGVLPDSALVSPRSLESITVTAAIPSLYNGSGWGRAGSDRPDSVGGGATVMLITLLTLLPAVGGLLGAGFVLARRLGVQVAALSLVGAPASAVRAVVAGSVVRASGRAVLIGAVVGGAAVWLGSQGGVWGVPFFRPSLAVIVGSGIAVAAVVMVALLVSARVATRPGPRPPIQTRHRERRRHPLLLATGTVGLALLAAVFVTRVLPTANSSWIAFWQLAMVVGAVLVLIGAPALAGQVTVWLAARITPDTDLHVMLAMRRLAHRPTTVMTRTAVMSILLTVVALAGAVVAVLAQGAAPTSGGVWVASSYHVDDDSVSRLGALAGDDGVIAIYNDDRREVFGTCAALTVAYGRLTTPEGGECVDGRTYGAGELGVSMSGGGLEPITIDAPVDRVTTSDPATVSIPSGTWNAYLTDGAGDIDKWQSQILALAPITDFSYPGGDSTLVVTLPILRGLLSALVILGLAPAIASLFLFADVESPQLRAVGASLEQRRRAAVSTALAGSAVASVVGGGVALLVGGAYLSLDPEATTDLGTVATVAAVAIGVSLIAGASTAIGFARENQQQKSSAAAPIA